MRKTGIILDSQVVLQRGAHGVVELPPQLGGSVCRNSLGDVPERTLAESAIRAAPALKAVMPGVIGPVSELGNCAQAGSTRRADDINAPRAQACCVYVGMRSAHLPL